jgi:hypothetical protein
MGTARDVYIILVHKQMLYATCVQRDVTPKLFSATYSVQNFTSKVIFRRQLGREFGSSHFWIAVITEQTMVHEE